MPTSALPIDIAIEHHQAGRIDQAEHLYREILETNPGDRDALHLLGVAAYQAGTLDEAKRLIQKAIAVDGSHATFHNSLGAVYQAIGDLPAAIDCFQTSTMLDMDYAEGHANLGAALLKHRRAAEAVASLRRAICLKPAHAPTLNSLGSALRSLGQIAEATDCYRRGLESQESLWEAHNNLGNVLKDQCRTEEAIAHYRRAIELAPHATVVQSNLLCALHYRDGITPGELAEAHAEFNRAFGAPLRSSWRPHENSRDPDRPLRLGFLSPDLHRHPVGYFLVGVLERLDPAQAEAHCYSTLPTVDDLTARIRAASASWHDVHDLSDAAVAERIRADGIDILFDLAGHTGNNGLLAMARKPAPIQITWAGYTGTTGLEAIDSILADGHEIPPALEHHYAEKVLRMPDAYVCYEPPAYAPSVSPLPALRTGHVTFASFNNPAKLGPQVVEAWSRIMARLPESRLVLKYKGMDDPAHVERLSQLFAAKGIASGRVSFLATSPHVELLEHYGNVDIALDPFPYNGGLTTLESLWMGVPVVTCPGETFAGRHSLTHLSNAGLTSTIARDIDEYVGIAVTLANDLPGLAELRAGLRERMAASPLCDCEGFAENLMRLVRPLWREWAQSVDANPREVSP